MALYGFVYFMTMMTSGGKRGKIFTKEFMEQFNEEHQKVFGTDAPVGGHPDDGNGYYSAKLTYAQWYDFNNAQRAHLNFLETAIPVAAMVLICAINQPLLALICMIGLVLGRIMYAIGYRMSGPQGRIAGALIVDVALLAAFVGAIMSLVQWDMTSVEPRMFPMSAK
tara:strand:- start:92 stop:592 length:501 start_codon:yes stop_codon:yes gene_type:complete